MTIVPELLPDLEFIHIQHVKLKASKLEYLIALTAVGWGAWLLNPNCNTFGSAAIFTLMKTVAPENWWGAAMACVGAFQGVAALRGDIGARKVAAITSFISFLIIAIFCAASSIQNTAAWTYFCLFLFAFAAYTEVWDWDDN